MPPERQQLKAIGDAIRDQRKRSGITQEELAERANLHPNYLGRVERGEQWISLHGLLRVATALGVRARDLVRDV